MVESSGGMPSISSPKDSEKEVVPIVVDVSELRTRSPFKDLFPIRPDVQKAIEKDMEVNGYDPGKPIAVWKIKGERVIIAGHTRYEAAIAEGLREISIFEREFKDDEEALQYALDDQTKRRNLTDGDLLHCIMTLSVCKKKRGPKNNLASGDAKPGKSSEDLASVLNTCARKVERALAVIRSGNQEIQQNILQDKMTINRAYNRIKQKDVGKTTSVSTDDKVRKAKAILSCPECLQKSWVQEFLKQAQRVSCTHEVSKAVVKKGGETERNKKAQ
jgi:ParB-like chromosome segregation protein Spo0J